MAKTEAELVGPRSPWWTVEVMLEGRIVMRHAFATQERAEEYVRRVREIEREGDKRDGSD